MIHYHGLPITPETAAIRAVDGGHAFVSHAYPNQLDMAVNVCQSFAVDNGAFSAWRKGSPMSDWNDFYSWVSGCVRIPSFDFAVIPDVIDGSEEENDKLLAEWPFDIWVGAPVWHMHESEDRLHRLASKYPRICIGSSGDYATVGNARWWSRISTAMRVVCDEFGRPMTKLHGLRMLNPAVFTKLPFASADSTNIARNIGIDSTWKGNYMPKTKEGRVDVLRGRIEKDNAPAICDFSIFELCASQNQGGVSVGMTLLAMVVYASAMTIANMTVFAFGPWFSPINAFVLIGLDLALRDWLHYRLRWWQMGALILVSGSATFLLNPSAGMMAVASATAFTAAALVDWSIFSALGKRSWLTRANWSNVGGAAVDSILFPTIAFGVFMPGVVLAQFAAKVLGGSIWAALIFKIEAANRGKK